MLFNSIEFLLFLPAAFLLYWFLFKPLRRQNAFLLGASYLFYAWWDWRFLSLIFGASIIAYICAIGLGRIRSSAGRRVIVTLEVCVSLGMLAAFKYFNFFMTNLSAALAPLGIQLDEVSLQLVLPVGISFYTFQSLGYVIDVYRRKIEPSRNIVEFLAFVSYFPQLVAGPIERASNLLPQFQSPRRFDYADAVAGMRQMLWGFFKKVVVADSCAAAADFAFDNYSSVGGINLIIGALLFTFQIYGDFSGYSDIAIGASRLFGIRLMQNFNYPYFSRNIAEFWRRWHISLTSWFRDYLYIPLGGSRRGLWLTVRNTIIVFVVSGLWHDADWTFITWGFFNALLFLPLLLAGTHHRYTKDTVAEGRALPSLREMWLMILTYALAVAGFVFFRAESMEASGAIFHKMVTNFSYTPGPGFKAALIYVALMLVVEWSHRTDSYGLCIHGRGLMRWRWARWTAYYLLALLVVYNWGSNEAFIYFQF